MSNSLVNAIKKSNKNRHIAEAKQKERNIKRSINKKARNETNKKISKINNEAPSNLLSMMLEE